MYNITFGEEDAHLRTSSTKEGYNLMRIPRLVTIPLGQGFNPRNVVTNRSPINEKAGTYTDDGIFSERIFGKMAVENIEYACDHRHLEGKFYKGMICPECNTEVKLQNSTFAKTGWIHFENNGDEFPVINPLIYAMMAKIVGGKELQKVLQYNVKLDLSGMVIRGNEKKYHAIGMYKFQEIWQEVLSHYCKPDKMNLFRFILANSSKIFTSKVPIFPVALRPAVIADKSIKFAEVNNFFNYMVAESQNLRSLTGELLTEYTSNQIMWRSQLHYNKIYSYIVKAIGGKKKYLRNNIFGARVNMSARNVIGPMNPKHGIDEVELPYLTCMELYKFEVCNMYRTLKNCSLLVAHDAWTQACAEPSELFLRLIQELIRQAKPKYGIKGLPLLINRNPTLQLGSIMRVILTRVKSDFTDLTMSLHNCILAPSNADFDGDVLNIIKIPDMYFFEAFEVFDPASSLMISRDMPELTEDMELTKEHPLGMLLMTEV